MSPEEQRKRYLNNPYFKVTPKIRKQLGLDTNEVSNGDVAVEIDEPVVRTKKQVVRSRRGRTNNSTANDN